jgi:CspA family cold shock protein
MSQDKDIYTHCTCQQLTGRVKWFNTKAGYGFITVHDGSLSGSDVFVHHSTIQVNNQQYKYLVQGEYVDFIIDKTTSKDHEYQVVDVHGIKGGKLMCETRHEFKLARTSYKGVRAP